MRRKAEFKCALSGRVCPFNSDFWDQGLAGLEAADNCPIEKYENSNHGNEDGSYTFDDWCKYLIARVGSEGKQ